MPSIGDNATSLFCTQDLLDVVIKVIMITLVIGTLQKREKGLRKRRSIMKGESELDCRFCPDS
jgi:hypothetical protein